MFRFPFKKASGTAPEFLEVFVARMKAPHLKPPYTLKPLKPRSSQLPPGVQLRSANALVSYVKNFMLKDGSGTLQVSAGFSTLGKL